VLGEQHPGAPNQSPQDPGGRIGGQITVSALDRGVAGPGQITPSLTPASGRRRRTTDIDSDDEELNRSSRSGTPFSQISNGSKRIRLGSRDRGGGDEEGISDGGDKASE